MTNPSILVAGIGNIFKGDDAFGVEVATRLATRDLPVNVRVSDFGIRSFDLAFALLEEYEITLLVDAGPRGGKPGTLYLIEPDLNNLEDLEQQSERIDAHGMNPVVVLRLAKSMGGHLGRILLVGCEPETFGPEDEGRMGLSPVVEQAVEHAVKRIESLIKELTCETRGATTMAV
jgi:hydrogenase maturation protease